MKAIAFIKNFPKTVIILLGLVVAVLSVMLTQGYNLLVVQSGSMEPAVSPGSVILVKKNSYDYGERVVARYAPGDIISYASGVNNTMVSHRVAAVTNNNGEFTYQTKGDANEQSDKSLVPESKVLGKAVFTAPVVGRFVNYAKPPAGFLLLIAIPCLYIIFSESIKLLRELRKKPPIAVGLNPKLYMKLPLSELMVFFTVTFLISSTFALFSDIATSTSNIFTAAAVFGTPTPTPTPNPGEVYIDEVVSLVGSYGHCCSPGLTNIVEAQAAIDGAPDGDFIQIADNTVLIVKFVNNKAVNLSDPDIRVYNFDIFFPGSAKFEIGAGPDCQTTSFIDKGNFFDTSIVDLDIAGTGLTDVQCIRITDLVDTVNESGVPYVDTFPLLGFDLDAIEALHSVAIP